MIFYFGRDNLALTIFVPYDCKNKCPFCISKENYKTHKPSMRNVKHQLKRVLNEYSYPIKDIVFTGGEPMSDIDGLRDLVDLIPEKYNVYINTTLTKRNLQNFVDFVNGCKKIKGVNISRHSETYEQDCALLCDIAEDKQIEMIKKPVRINCVVKNQDIPKIIARWKGLNVDLYFRKDFNTEQSFTELHDPYDELTMKLIAEQFSFKSHTQCNVCDTIVFEKDGQIVAYHKGQKKSSIKVGFILEINDLIIDQTGTFTFDWDENDLEIVSELEKKYKKNSQSAIIYRGSCGGGGC